MKGGVPAGGRQRTRQSAAGASRSRRPASASRMAAQAVTGFERDSTRNRACSLINRAVAGSAMPKAALQKGLPLCSTTITAPATPSRAIRAVAVSRKDEATESGAACPLALTCPIASSIAAIVMAHLIVLVRPAQSIRCRHRPRATACPSGSPSSEADVRPVHQVLRLRATARSSNIRGSSVSSFTLHRRAHSHRA